MSVYAWGESRVRVKHRPSLRHMVRVTGGDRMNVRLRGSVRF